jgi:CelD/BcsL family acetyltransferase involved in cellulose biosynthesis
MCVDFTSAAVKEGISNIRPAIEVEVYTSFEKCEAELADLHNQTQNTNPFLTVDMLKLWWQHFGKKKSLYIILFRDERKAVGFAPFYRVYRHPLRIIECHLIGDGFSSYLDMVCKSGYEQLMLEALFRHFKSLSTGVIIHFNDINDRFSRFYSLLYDRLKEPNYEHASVIKLYPCPLSFLGDNWADFFKSQRGYQHRRDLRQKFQRLSSTMGNFRFREVTDCAELPILFPKLEQLHNERFRQTLSFHGQQRIFQLLSSVMDKMLGSHLLLFVSELDDMPLSFSLGFRMGKFFTGYKMAFDPAFAALSLGNLQMAEVMEKLISKGFEYMDFSKGEAPYKRFWSNDETTCYLFHFGFNLNMIGSWYFQSLDGRIKFIGYLKKRGYNDKIKQLLERLKRGKSFSSTQNPVRLEEIPTPHNLDRANLPQWSYQTIRDLPVDVRYLIIKCGLKSKLSLMRIDNLPSQRKLLLISEDNKSYRLKY